MFNFVLNHKMPKMEVLLSVKIFLCDYYNVILTSDYYKQCRKNAESSYRCFWLLIFLVDLINHSSFEQAYATSTRNKPSTNCRLWFLINMVKPPHHCRTGPLFNMCGLQHTCNVRMSKGSSNVFTSATYNVTLLPHDFSE